MLRGLTELTEPATTEGGCVPWAMDLALSSERGLLLSSSLVL